MASAIEQPPTRTSKVMARWIVAPAVIVAAGSLIAAVNWYNSWTRFALTIGTPGSYAAVQAEATMHKWMLVCLASTIAAVAGSGWAVFADRR